MDFSLNRYILNEALSSNILRNILNEPTGFFKLSKIFSLIEHNKGKRFNSNDGGPHDITKDILDINVKLCNTIYELFGGSEQLYNEMRSMVSEANSTRLEAGTEGFDSYKHNTGAEMFEPKADLLINTRYDSMDDNELIRVNKEYTALLNQMYSKAKNLMNRPDPAALFSIINKNNYFISNREQVRQKSGPNREYNFKELSSLTDGNFKKYTITELKADKDMQKELQNPESNTVGLYFSAGGSFCGASASGQVILNNPFIENDKNAPERKQTKHAEYITKVFEDPEFYFPCYIMRTPLHNSARKLTWPIIGIDNIRGRYSYETYNTFKLITKYLQNDIQKTNEQMFQRKSIGSGYISTNKIIEPASNLRQILFWGYDKADYVWVLRPYGSLDVPEIEAQRALGNYRADLKDTGGQQPEEHYKWAKDSLFRMQPYRVGSDTQTVTVFDKETQTYKNYKVTSRSANRMMEQGIDVVFSNNPDTFVEAVRKNINKRKLVFRGKKAVKAAVDTINARLMEVTEIIAEKISETDKRATKLKQVLRKLTLGDKQLVKNMLFATSCTTSSEYEALFKNAGFEEDEYNTNKLIYKLGGYGVQYKINKFIIGISDVQHSISKISENIKEVDVLKMDEYYINRVVKETVDRAENIKASIEQVPEEIDLQLSIIDKVLEKY